MLPDKIEFEGNNYDMTKNVSRVIDNLYKTHMLLSPYYFNKTKE
jgi:hypothetical protein